MTEDTTWREFEGFARDVDLDGCSDLVEQDDPVAVDCIYLNTQIGKCLVDVLNDMYIEGKITAPELSSIPYEFNSDFQSILARKYPNELSFTLKGKLQSYQDLPYSSNWVAKECELTAVTASIKLSDAKIFSVDTS